VPVFGRARQIVLVHFSKTQIQTCLPDAPGTLAQKTNQQIDCTMGNKVWVKLVIGGDDDRSDAFGIKITSETDVDDLKNAIVEKAQRLFDKDIHSLNVYLPGTNVLGPDYVNPLRPGLPLSDLDFREITDETPLIVTAKSRPQQQQQDTNVSLYTYVPSGCCAPAAEKVRTKNSMFCPCFSQ
jgi:hypothetical protein